MPKDHPTYKGWYITDGGLLCPYDEQAGGPRRHPDYKSGFMHGISFFWDERKGILHFSEAGRFYDDHGVGTIAASTIEEVEFLLTKFLTVSTA